MTSKSDKTNGFFKALVTEMGVDLGGRNLPVTKGTLHQSQVPGHAVEPRGERVAQRVDRGPVRNASCLYPLRDAVLDLAGAEAFPNEGLEEGRSPADSVSFDIRGEDFSQRGIDEDRLGSAAFGSDIDRALFEINSRCIKTHQRGQANSRTQEQGGDGEIPLGKWFRGLRNSIKQGLALGIRESGGRLPLTRPRFHEPGGIAVDDPRLREIVEEGPDCAFKAVGRYGASILALCADQGGVRCEEAGNVSRRDGFDVFHSADPAGKKPELPHVGGNGMRASAVGPKLGMETLNGLISSHEAPPILDIPSYIHELTRRIVKLIMRTSGELTVGMTEAMASYNPHERPISAPCGAILRRGGQ